MSLPTPKCFAPWYHTYVGPQGERALCCHAKSFSHQSNVQEVSFEKFWNGPEMESVREIMLTGELPPEYCGSCIKGEGYSEVPLHLYQLSSQEWQALYESKQKRGENIPPSYLDYRLGNQCNFSCRTCNENYSSKIEGVYNHLYPQRGFFLPDEVKEREFSLLVQKSSLKKLYFAHGEPLLQKKHWQLLKSLASQEERAGEITLEYNTNLGHEILFKEENRKILKKFKKVRVGVSLDDVGPSGEFIRDGLVWNRFVRNFYQLKSDPLYEFLSLDITFTLPLLLDLRGLLKFLIEQKVAFTVEMIKSGGYSQLLNPAILPLALQKNLYEKALKDLESFKNTEEQHYLGPFKDFVTECLSYLKQEIDEQQVAHELVESLRVDENFKRANVLSFYKKHPEVYEFFSRLLEIGQQTNDHESIQQSQEEAFWLKTLENFESSKAGKKLIFPSLEELCEELKISTAKELYIVTSYPGLFTKTLNRNSKNHFDVYKYLSKNFKDQMVLEKRLNLFHYLAFKMPQLSWPFQLINLVASVTIPFLNSFSLVKLNLR